MVTRIGCLVGLVLALAQPGTAAQIAGFQTFSWSLAGTPSGSGTQDASTMLVIGPNGFGGCAEHGTWFEAVSPVSGSLSVDVDFENHDSWAFAHPHFDAPAWRRNDELLTVPPMGSYIPEGWPSGQYHIEFIVLAGESFGLGVWSLDCFEGPGVATFTNLLFTPVDVSGLGHGLDHRLRFELEAPAGTSLEWGRSVTTAGDLDGDSVPDVIVAAPGEVQALSGVDGTTLYATTGPADFGTAVAGLGDATGDGRPDFVVGAPSMSVNSIGEGAAWVLSGATGDYVHVVLGLAPHQQLGTAMAGLDDIDGDGRADYAVGAPWPTSVGLVKLISGATGASLWTTAGTLWKGRFGAALARIADLDADGVPDLLVGEPGDGSPASMSRVHVVSGASGASLLVLSGDGGFGTAVTRAGDVDGDGLEDLAVSAPLAAGPGGNVGRVGVWSSADASLLSEFVGTSPGALFGAGLAGGFDLNGDGATDLLIGAPLEADAVGFPSGAIHVVGARDSRSIATFAGSTEQGGFGASVAIIGDLNGDGLSDAVAGGGPGIDASVPKLVAVYQDLDHRGPPTLELQGDPLPGQPVTLSIENAHPGAPVLLVFGTSLALLPLKGGLLVPEPQVMVPLAASGQGSVSLITNWPRGMPLWTTVFLQAWEQDSAGPQGWLASAGLAAAQIVP